MYETNHVPPMHMETSTTGCCPQFNPAEWDGQTLKFEDKNFVKVASRSFLFMPLNLGAVITRTWKAIEAVGAKDPNEFIMMSLDASPWKTEHYFWTAKKVPGMENVKMTGTFAAKTFEGPYQNAKQWYSEMMKLAAEKGVQGKPQIYFYYTTCPKCAKTYGKNYVVGLVKVG